MASFIENICSKNYLNLSLSFQVTIDNDVDVFDAVLFTLTHILLV